MIQRHTIKYEGNEEVLYLYLDFSYEFADELGNMSKSIFSSIKKYLKSIKEDFKGTKVVIVASGIVLATLTLNVGLMRQNEVTKNNDTLYITSVHFNEPNVIAKEDVKVEKQEEIKQEDTIKPSTNQTSTTTNKTTTTTSKKNNSNSENKTTTSNKKTPTKQASSTKAPTKQVSNNKPSTTSKQDTVKKEEAKKNEVTVYRSNGSVLKIELEEYLIGVVAAEMPASFNTEALKAQAVLARTYALKTVKQGKKLTDTVATQVYKDNSQLKKVWGSDYSKYYNKVKSAVDSTKGMTAKYNGGYIEAVYHSISNGKTEDSKNVWGNSFPYLKVVDSSVDKNVKGYSKTVTKSYSDVSSKLGISVTKDSNIEINRNASGRVSTIVIDGKSYTGITIRNKLGLRSADFDIEKEESNLKITTRGYGHGVGMSQYGANEYAKKGWGYKKIITYYYPGVTIS